MDSRRFERLPIAGPQPECGGLDLSPNYPVKRDGRSFRNQYNCLCTMLNKHKQLIYSANLCIKIIHVSAIILIHVARDPEY